MAVLRELLQRIRRLPWIRFGAGVVAGIGALAVTYVLRILGLGIFLPEVALDFVITRIPGSIESFFIGTMGEGAKVFGLLTALVVILALFGFGATWYRRIQHRVRNRWAVIGVYTGATLAVILLVALPLLGGGLVGSDTSAGAWGAAFSQAIGAWLYAAILDYLLVDVAERHPQGFSLSRRQFIAATLLAVGGTALALYGLGSFVARPARLAFASVADMFAKEVTSNDDFYTVTKNFIDPDVDAKTWRLEIDGLVSSPRSYSYDDLLARASTEEFVTLECVSNEVGGNLISTAKWEGIPLAELLNDTGVQADADWVAFSCADGYTVGVPLAKALNPTTLLALRMNGLLLSTKHGFPARIVVPGLYGMFDAKWLTKITLVQGEFLGFWQQKGWTNRGSIRATAIIATPRPDSVVGLTVTIGGVAFAGDRGISRVEVSTDGGLTWRDATLKTPALSGMTWVLWTYDWTPAGSGAYQLRARAYDGSGAGQERERNPPFPNGSSGYDAITLFVR